MATMRAQHCYLALVPGFVGRHWVFPPCFVYTFRVFLLFGLADTSSHSLLLHHHRESTGYAPGTVSCVQLPLFGLFTISHQIFVAVD